MTPHMNHLVYMILLAVMMVFFLRIVMICERGEWPSDGTNTLGAALRELLTRRRPS